MKSREERAMAKIPCPFVYARGRKCPGHIVGVSAFKADIQWTPDGEGKWRPDVGRLRSHYHLHCSESAHAENFGRDDSPRMKFWLEELIEMGIHLE
jgi:hypothetical protein